MSSRLAGELRVHPHGNTFVCKRRCFALCWPIDFTDPFLKPGLRVEKCENSTLAFSCGQRILHTHNNNNGGLHACVHAAEDIEPVRVTRAKYSAPLLLH